MPAAPPFMALFFMLVATILLLFSSIASKWNAVSFLDVVRDDTNLHFGPFGYTGSPSHVGYSFPGLEDSHPQIVYDLTKALILHTVCCGLATLALALGLVATKHRRTPYFTIAMAFTSTVTALATLIVWVMDMIVFGIARDDYRKQGISANYGAAPWMVLGAFLALVLGSASAGYIALRSYRVTRKVYH
jgi:multisubunit Na+/H+ antiporter MnhC subunit